MLSSQNSNARTRYQHYILLDLLMTSYCWRLPVFVMSAIIYIHTTSNCIFSIGWYWYWPGLINTCTYWVLMPECSWPSTNTRPCTSTGLKAKPKQSLFLYILTPLAGLHSSSKGKYNDRAHFIIDILLQCTTSWHIVRYGIIDIIRNWLLATISYLIYYIDFNIIASHEYIITKTNANKSQNATFIILSMSIYFALFLIFYYFYILYW